MGTGVSRFGWVELDAGMAIAVRAIRSFAQSAVALIITISLGLHGVLLMQVGIFVMIDTVGAALAAVAAEVLGDAVGRRQTLVPLSGLTAFAEIMLGVSKSFPVLLMTAFMRNLCGFVEGGGTGPREQAVLAVSMTPEGCHAGCRNTSRCTTGAAVTMTPQVGTPRGYPLTHQCPRCLP